MRNSGTAEEERHVEIDRHRFAPVVVAGLASVTAQQNSGRIHQAIEGTELVDRVCNQVITFI